jgi:hypothetical protein
MFARSVSLFPCSGSYSRGTGGTTGATEGGALLQLRLRGEMDKYLVSSGAIAPTNAIDYHQKYLKSGTRLQY